MSSYHSKESWTGHFNAKVDYRARYITREKESHFLILKRSVHQEDINLTFMHLRTSKYEKAKTDKNGSTTIHNYCQRLKYIALKKSIKQVHKKSPHT